MRVSGRNVYGQKAGPWIYVLADAEKNLGWNSKVCRFIKSGTAWSRYDAKLFSAVFLSQSFVGVSSYVLIIQFRNSRAGSGGGEKCMPAFS